MGEGAGVCGFRTEHGGRVRVLSGRGSARSCCGFSALFGVRDGVFLVRCNFVAEFLLVSGAARGFGEAATFSSSPLWSWA